MRVLVVVSLMWKVYEKSKVSSEKQAVAGAREVEGVVDV
jgi:hypothetical protein